MPAAVRRVPAPVTWPLRHQVLRPHQSVADQALPDDDDPDVASFAALDDGGQVLATARVAPAPAPAGLEDLHQGAVWQLRGMATRPDVRRQGLGSATLGAAIEHVADHGGGLLWCNARLGAVGLYRRAGLAEHGPVWEEPELGPHVVMWRLVPPADRP